MELLWWLIFVINIIPDINIWSLSHWVIGLLIGHFISLLQHPNLIKFGDTILIKFLFMYNNQSQLNRIFYTSAHQGLYELTPVVSNRALVQELWRVKVDSMFNLTWRHEFWSNSFLYIWPNQDKLRSLHTSAYQELYELTSIIANRALVQELWHVKVYSFLTW